MTVDALIVGIVSAESTLSALVKTFTGGLKLIKAFRSVMPTKYYDPVQHLDVAWDDKVMLPAMTYSQIGMPRHWKGVNTVYHYQIAVWHTTLGKARTLGLLFDAEFNGMYGTDSGVKLLNVTKTNEQDYTSEVSGRFALILDYDVNIRG